MLLSSRQLQACSGLPIDPTHFSLGFEQARFSPARANLDDRSVPPPFFSAIRADFAKVALQLDGGEGLRSLKSTLRKGLTNVSRVVEGCWKCSNLLSVTNEKA